MQSAERRDMHSSLVKIDQKVKNKKTGFISLNKFRKGANNYCTICTYNDSRLRIYNYVPWTRLVTIKREINIYVLSDCISGCFKFILSCLRVKIYSI